MQKLAIIYGANASGKSNLLSAMRIMRNIILGSARDSVKSDKLPFVPFRLSLKTVKEPTVFSVQFIAEGVRYHYGFAYNEDRIIEEFLDAYPKGFKQSWFERKWNEGAYTYSFSPSFSGEKEQIKQRTRDNTLFLSKSIDDNNKMLEPVWNWFRNLLVVNDGNFSRTAKLCKTDEGKAKIINFLLDADIPIVGINVEEKKMDISFDADDNDSLEQRKMKEIFGELVKIRPPSVRTEIKFTRKIADSGNSISFDFNDESEGTQKLFNLAALWMDASEKQTPLFFDELDTKLHPNLQEYLVNKFTNMKDSKAQLVFTSHNTNFLKNKSLRRDQFWFTELNKAGATELFSLTAVKEKSASPRKGEALEAGYLDGRYGAVPYLPSEE